MTKEKTMGQHNLGSDMDLAHMGASGKAIWMPSLSLHLLEWGDGAPSGTPASMFYFRTDAASVTEADALYVNKNGTWTAIEGTAH